MNNEPETNNRPLPRIPLRKRDTHSSVYYALLAVAVIAVIGAGIWFMFYRPGKALKPAKPTTAETRGPSAIVVFPTERELITERHSIPEPRSERARVESAIRELLRGPSKGRSVVSDGAELIAVHRGTDGVYYIDFSENMRHNFHGDALSELMLIRAIHSTVVSNSRSVAGVRILIEGSEAETLGGHIGIRGTIDEYDLGQPR